MVQCANLTKSRAFALGACLAGTSDPHDGNILKFAGLQASLLGGRFFRRSFQSYCDQLALSRDIFQYGQVACRFSPHAGWILERFGHGPWVDLGTSWSWNFVHWLENSRAQFMTTSLRPGM